jgi:uncharacterized protein
MIASALLSSMLAFGPLPIACDSDKENFNPAAQQRCLEGQAVQERMKQVRCLDQEARWERAGRKCPYRDYDDCQRSRESIRECAAQGFLSGTTNCSAPPPKVAQITPQSEAAQPGTAVQRPPASSSAQPTDEAGRFASKVLRQNEDRWREIFEKSGGRYQAPHLVLFRGRVQSACGLAQSAMGRFYCPFDRKIYLDTSLFAELEKRFHGCSGKACQFSKAYVIAREYGHHVQNLLGILPKVQQLQRGLSKTEANRMQVRVELQADCLAGVWANRQQREAVFLDPGDAEAALTTASAIDDDRGDVVPAHGSSDQRIRWFNTGFKNGTIESCNTFAADNL